LGCIRSHTSSNTSAGTIAYKIITADEFDQFITKGVFEGTPKDRKNGYICTSSTKEQIERIKQKYYHNQQIYLLTIGLENIKNIRFKGEHEHDIYPHIYGTLTHSDIIASEPSLSSSSSSSSSTPIIH
jgi:uncharacterized protein (DUF952 family)